MLTTGSPSLDTEGHLHDEEYHYTTEGPVTTGRRPSYVTPTGSRALATRSSGKEIRAPQLWHTRANAGIHDYATGPSLSLRPVISNTPWRCDNLPVCLCIRIECPRCARRRGVLHYDTDVLGMTALDRLLHFSWGTCVRATLKSISLMWHQAWGLFVICSQGQPALHSVSAAQFSP